MTVASVCVYCGSSPGARPVYVEAARAFGALLAGRGLTLVYGGSDVGCMKALADAALAAGGRVRGVIPRGMVDREIAHRGLSELVVVESMHERKAAMAERADAFVALPGGAGTLDELFETWTWGQLGLHAKPVGLLDVEGYWQPLLSLLDHIEREGFLKPVHRRALLVSPDGPSLLAQMEAWQPLVVEKWVRPPPPP